MTSTLHGPTRKTPTPAHRLFTRFRNVARSQTAVRSIITLGFLLSFLFTPTAFIAPATAATEAIRTDAFCKNFSMPRGDDGSSSQVSLPFEMNFFGNTYSSLYVNNNGNVTFNSPLSSYTPSALTGNTGRPMIAAYFADVDTRNPASQTVTYGWSDTQFCVNWVGVGFYDSRADKLISAQLIITDRSDETGEVGDVRVELNYSDIQWETGGASQGIDGLGGTSAAVGYTAGTGQLGTYSQFEGSLVPGSLIDGGPNALVSSSRNSSVLGRYVFEVGGEIPIPEGNLRGEVTDTNGDPIEASIEICSDDDGNCVSTVASTSGKYSTIGLVPGDYTVTATPPAGSDLLPASRTVTISPGETSELDFVLRTEPAGSVEISVVDMFGNLVDGASLTVCETSSSDCIAGVPATNDSTPLSLSDVPVGDYDIAVTAPIGSDLLDGTSTVEVVDAETSTVTITLLPLTNRTITGTVTDDDGNPIRATLSLHLVDGSTQTLVTSSSPLLGTGQNPQRADPDGSFTWTVAAGTYRVSALAESCEQTSEDVTFDNEGIGQVSFALSCDSTTGAGQKSGENQKLDRTAGNLLSSLGLLAFVLISLGATLVLVQRRRTA